MTYLFDTNAWIRSIERPEEITASVSSVLLNSSSTPFGLSAISIYEIGQKVRKGRLVLSIPLDRWPAIALRPAFVSVIPIDGDIAREANELPGDFHGDPADRLIVATARKHNLTVLTSDRKIQDYSSIHALVECRSRFLAKPSCLPRHNFSEGGSLRNE
jgi:PIN domain nuclease of toxin-antitoxin system